MTEHDALLILNASPGLGNARILRLIEKTGSAGSVLSLKNSDLQKITGLSNAVLDKFVSFPRHQFLDNERRLIERLKIRVVALGDKNYPDLLRNIPDAPVVLYVKGQVSVLGNTMLSIVGARRASLYGQTTSQRLAASLASQGLTIVSGLARGIDTAAHRGALQAGGETVAVLGSGLDQIYPGENIRLAEQITEHGALVSEFPLEAPPTAYHFPRRNRIISGLSLGVVVVEAALNSGALITCDFALEQGREVFAVPGQVDHPNAQGTHRLIQQGAKLIGSVEDILEEIKGPYQRIRNQPKTPESRREIQIDLSETEQKIYQCLEQTPISTQELSDRFKDSLGVIQHALLRLELKHLIKQLPGQFVSKS